MLIPLYMGKNILWKTELQTDLILFRQQLHLFVYGQQQRVQIHVLIPGPRVPLIQPAQSLTTRRIDVEENAEKNRENARLSVKTPTKNVEKVAYSGTHHKKTEYRNHKPRSN